jgi:hypothetical protein
MHGVEYTILENLILRLYYGQDGTALIVLLKSPRTLRPCSRTETRELFALPCARVVGRQVRHPSHDDFPVGVLRIGGVLPALKRQASRQASENQSARRRR